MNIKLLTEYHFEFLSLKGGCTGSFEFTLVKMPHCWKSHIYFLLQYYGAWSNYKSAISYFCKDQKYRLQAVNIAKEEGLLPVAKRSESKRRTKVSTC